MIHIVVAMSRNRVIGKNNQLPWKIPEDLKRFKALTLGKWVVMGRKTHESIGKLLPDRTNVVVTRNFEKVKPEGIILVNSLNAILDWGVPDDLYIIGGAEIYQQAIHRADMLHVTFIDADFEGDTYFPEIDEKVWELIEQVVGNPGGSAHPDLSWYYQTYRRKKNTSSSE